MRAFLDVQTRVPLLPFFSFLILFDSLCIISCFTFLFAACSAINKINWPKYGQMGRQKRTRLNQDPRGKPDAPIFLMPHVPENPLGDDGVPPAKGTISGPTRVSGRETRWLGPSNIRWIGPSTLSLHIIT